MPKIIDSMIDDSRRRMELWADVKNDPEALDDRNKNKWQAEMLENYFEGMMDGFMNIMGKAE